MDKSLVVNMRKATIRSIVFVRLTMLALIALAPNPIDANPYLAKPGEAMTTVQVATCAVSGGFVHLYTAIDNGLFDKYAIKVEHKFISGSAMNLDRLIVRRDFTFSIAPPMEQSPDWPAVLTAN